MYLILCPTNEHIFLHVLYDTYLYLSMSDFKYDQFFPVYDQRMFFNVLQIHKLRDIFLVFSFNFYDIGQIFREYFHKLLKIFWWSFGPFIFTELV